MGELYDYLTTQKMKKLLQEIRSNVTANVEVDAVPIDNDFITLNTWFDKLLKKTEENAKQ